MITEVTTVLYPAPVAAPSLAEYSKGSSTLCDGHSVMPSAVSLRPALAAGTKARIRYLFSSDYRNGLLVRSAALRCGVPVFTVERVCIVEVSALRRPSGAC